MVGRSGRSPPARTFARSGDASSAHQFPAGPGGPGYFSVETLDWHGTITSQHGRSTGAGPAARSLPPSVRVGHQQCLEFRRPPAPPPFSLSACPPAHPPSMGVTASLSRYVSASRPDSDSRGRMGRRRWRRAGRVARTSSSARAKRMPSSSKLARQLSWDSCSRAAHKAHRETFPGRGGEGGGGGAASRCTHRGAGGEGCTRTRRASTTGERGGQAGRWWWAGAVAGGAGWQAGRPTSHRPTTRTAATRLVRQLGAGVVAQAEGGEAWRQAGVAQVQGAPGELSLQQGLQPADTWHSTAQRAGRERGAGEHAKEPKATRQAGRGGHGAGLGGHPVSSASSRQEAGISRRCRQQAGQPPHMYCALPTSRVVLTPRAAHATGAPNTGPVQPSLCESARELLTWRQV